MYIIILVVNSSYRTILCKPSLAQPTELTTCGLVRHDWTMIIVPGLDQPTFSGELEHSILFKINEALSSPVGLTWARGS